MLLIKFSSQKPDSLVLGVQKPGVGGALGQSGGQLGGLGGGQLGGLGGSQPEDCARFQNTRGHTTRDVFFFLPISFDMSTYREEQTDEKSNSRIKEVESNSSSGPRQHGQSPNLGGCPNGQKTVQKNSSSAVCISSLPPSNLALGHCQGSNSKDPSTNKAPSLALSSSSSSSCQKQPPECQGGGSEASKAISSNGVKGKGEGKGSKGGHHHHHHHHHHHQHARRLVINLDDKNKFTEEVTV